MELESYLRELQKDPRITGPVRKDVERALANLAQNVVPAPSTILRLTNLSRRENPCTRQSQDGACAWFRQWGAHEGFEVPPIGVRAMCPFKMGRQAQCSGYSKS